MAELYRTKKQNHSLGQYLNEIRSISLIDADEEVQLAKRIKEVGGIIPGSMEFPTCDLLSV